MNKPLRICIDARLEDGMSGGVQQVVIGLASALSHEAAADEEYLFLVYENAHDWLSPFLDEPSKLLETRRPEGHSRARGVARAVVGVAGHYFPRTIKGLAGRVLDLPASDGTVERSGADVLHFPTPAAFLSEVPSIYQPHDLQHLYLPELFSAPLYAKRERTYRAFCAQAEAVVMMTRVGRDDLVARYDVPTEKVYVIPGASVLDAYPEPTAAELLEVRARFSLPDSFLLYPAQTWAHKNHLGLLKALARARDASGIQIPLVCTGTKTDHFRELERVIGRLGLEELVAFAGFISPLELNALYRIARGLVFPSLFEGWGLPVTEAFSAGIPVLCSDIPVLREQAGDAALFFSATDEDELANALIRLWTDETLRKELVTRGVVRVGALSQERTTRTFRALYRRLGGATLSEEDAALLARAVLERACARRERVPT